MNEQVKQNPFLKFLSENNIQLSAPRTPEQRVEDSMLEAEEDLSSGPVRKSWMDRVEDACPVANWIHVFASPDVETIATTAVKKLFGHGNELTRNLVLRGGVGTGKTTAACIAVSKYLAPRVTKAAGEYGPYMITSRHSREVSWLRPDELVSAVLHSYDSSSPKLASMLIVDDMGRETKADFPEALCTILDSGRHRLLITTNLTKQQMRERYDLRLIDRLNEHCVAVDVPGKSMRRQDGGF